MTMRRCVVIIVLAIGGGGGALACSSSSSADERAPCADPQTTPATTDPAPVGATTFTAFSQNFSGFHAWTSMPAVSTHAGDTGLHGDGAMTVYINRLPPHGAGEFPVGTIIVKESNGGDVRDRQVFAMVKRGASFNASGAKGWEWFELQGQCGKDEPVISWRGVGPPAGEKYGGDTRGCNPCHANQAENDFVRTDGLTLSSF